MLPSFNTDFSVFEHGNLSGNNLQNQQDGSQDTLKFTNTSFLNDFSFPTSLQQFTPAFSFSNSPLAPGSSSRTGNPAGLSNPPSAPGSSIISSSSIPGTPGSSIPGTPSSCGSLAESGVGQSTPSSPPGYTYNSGIRFHKRILSESDMDQDTKMDILESSNFSFNKESSALRQPEPTQNNPSLPLHMFSNTPTNLLSEIGPKQVSDLPIESNLATQSTINPQNNQYKILDGSGQTGLKTSSEVETGSYGPCNSWQQSKMNRRNSRMKSTKTTHQSVCETAVECSDCGLRFDNTRFLNLHRILLHSSKQNRVFQLKVYKCCHCSCEIQNYEDFLEHLDKTHDDQRHVCKFCNKMFKLRGSLLVHQRVIHHNAAPIDPTNIHTPDPDLKPDQQGNPDPKPTYLVSSTGQSPLIRNINGDEDSGEIQNNIKIEDAAVQKSQESTEQNGVPEKGEIVEVYQLPDTGPEKSCNMCTKTFTDNFEFVKHVKTHQEAKQFDCSVCYKKFTTKYFLKKHRRLHTGETPYTCNLCGKTFVFQQSYHKHMLYHTDEKPYSCSTCNRAFKELSTLQNHERIHTGERPFVCDFCGKSFRQRVSYLVHRRIHTGALPYICNFCGKKFRYKVTQRTHKCLGRNEIDNETNYAQTSPSYQTGFLSAAHTPMALSPAAISPMTSITAVNSPLEKSVTALPNGPVSPVSSSSAVLNIPTQQLISEAISQAAPTRLHQQQVEMTAGLGSSFLEASIQKNISNRDKQKNENGPSFQIIGNRPLVEENRITFQTLNNNGLEGSIQFSQLPSYTSNFQNNIQEGKDLMRYRDPLNSKSPPYTNTIPSEIKKNLLNFRMAQGKRRLGYRLQNILERSKQRNYLPKADKNCTSPGYEADLQLLSISGQNRNDEEAVFSNIGEKSANSPRQGDNSAAPAHPVPAPAIGDPAPAPGDPAPGDPADPVHLESFLDYPVGDDGFLDFPAGDNKSSEENYSAAHHQALLNFDISALQDS